jgi:uncharacterized membrane protein YidH (DUF202 family)
VAAGANPILSSTKMSYNDEATFTAWMNSSISLLGNQLILNMFAFAQIKD